MRILKLKARSRAPDLQTYTPRQLLIGARNRSDVCSRNRPNPRESNSKASHVKAESEHRSSKRRSNFTGAEVEVLLQDVDVPFYSTMAISTRLSSVLIYLFTYICSVLVVLLFILGHHNAS